MEYTTELFWWQVGDKRFNNKWAAEREAKKTNLYSEFTTNHQLYRNALADGLLDDDKDYDLEFLKRIRDTFNHTRLHYTGGYDSHTLLTRSLENGISPDETITVMAGDNKIISDACDKEYTLSALPFLKTIDTKSIIMRTGYDLPYHLYKDPEWIFNIRGGYTFVRLHCMNFAYYDPINNQTDCNIIGKERPILVRQGNKWYATIMDNIIFDHLDLPKSIFFWLHPDNIKSFVKDARRFRDFVVTRQEQKVIYTMSQYKGQDYEDASLSIGRRQVPNDITGKNNMSKVTGKVWCNGKDKAFINDVIKHDKIEFLSNYYSTFNRLKEEFPDLIEDDGFIKRWLPSKMPFYIDLDTLEYFEENEITLDFEK